MCIGKAKVGGIIPASVPIYPVLTLTQCVHCNHHYTFTRMRMTSTYLNSIAQHLNSQSTQMHSVALDQFWAANTISD